MLPCQDGPGCIEDGSRFDLTKFEEDIPEPQEWGWDSVPWDYHEQQDDKEVAIVTWDEGDRLEKIFAEFPNYSDEKESLEKFNDNENRDELYKTAVELIKSERKASTSFLQRKLQIGYNRAARIIDMMEEDKIVGKANHVGKREVL